MYLDKMYRLSAQLVADTVAVNGTDCSEIEIEALASDENLL